MVNVPTFNVDEVEVSRSKLAADARMSEFFDALADVRGLLDDETTSLAYYAYTAGGPLAMDPSRHDQAMSDIYVIRDAARRLREVFEAQLAEQGAV